MPFIHTIVCDYDGCTTGAAWKFDKATETFADAIVHFHRLGWRILSSGPDSVDAITWCPECAKKGKRVALGGNVEVLPDGSALY
jgi:hypothetical protein